MEKELPHFEFGISRILDCGFTIEEAITPEEGKIKLGYGMNFLFDVPASWIQFNIRADFKHSDTDYTFLTGTVLTRFSVKDLGGFVDENDKVLFPRGSLETLFGIAFGHLRAILSKNAVGSRFANIIIPVVNPSTLFNDLLQINIDKLNEAIAKGDVEIVKKSELNPMANIDLTTKAKKSKKKI